MKYIAKLLLICVIATLGVGCQENNYRQKTIHDYMQNPAELKADMRYCRDYPEAAMCPNVMKQHALFMEYHNQGSSKISKSSPRVWLNLDKSWDEISEVE